MCRISEGRIGRRDVMTITLGLQLGFDGRAEREERRFVVTYLPIVPSRWLGWLKCGVGGLCIFLA